MPHDEHGLDRIRLADLMLRQQRRIEPAGTRNARRFHQRLARKAGLHPLIVHFPHPAPMPPGIFGKTVVKRQCRYIEAEIGGSLHVGMAAKYICPTSGVSHIAGGEKQDAACTNVRRAGRELGLPHRPDQCCRLFLGKDFRDVLDLRFRQTRDALNLAGDPLCHLLADFIDAVDALVEEFLVLPTVLEDVPEHPVNRRNMSAGPHADILSRVRRGSRHPRVDHDHVGAVKFLAFKDMLKRNRMRLRRIAAHQHDRLGVADIVVAVRHRAIAPGIGYAGDGGGMADARLMIGIIGSPESRELAVEVGGFVGELGRTEPVNRVRP